MYLKLLIGLVVFLMLGPAFSEGDSGRAQADILKKLEEIDQRLRRIEQDIKQLQAGQFPGRRAPTDVRQSPEYQALERQLHALQEKNKSETLKDPAEIWRALGEPKELSRRLDLLMEAFSPTISVASTQEEFKKDVEALKEELGKEVSDEELYEKVRQTFLEKLGNTENEREKAWLRRELDSLEKSRGEEREMMVGRFIRFENLRALHQLAQKYSISREQMMKCGLAFMGPGRRPGGEPDRRERPGRPGPPSRGTRREQEGERRT